MKLQNKINHYIIKLIQLPIINNIYDWLIRKLPYKIMYKHEWIDSQHKLWIPRFGYSKKQLAEAEKEAIELLNKINWNGNSL